MIWPSTLFAHHLVGGELTYTCIGYNDSTDEYSYLINLVVYNNCSFDIEVEFDSTVTIDVFRNNLLYGPRHRVDFDNKSFINTDVDDSCAVNPDEACVQRVEYNTIINLQFDDGPFDVTYQRCCRIGSIKNLEDPITSGMTLTAHIQEPQNGICNSSPVFNELPPAFICLGQELSLDFSATDPDGDELTYNLCTPLLGASEENIIPIVAVPPPYSEVIWAPGYSAEFPLTANPQVELDSVTGILTGKPTLGGIYSIGICVSEFRNGVLLSEIKRDFEVFVFDCLQPISLFAEQSNDQLCDGFEITFENKSLNAESYLWDFGVENLDSDTSIEFEPTFLFPDSGTYEVMLIAMPYTNCADTSYQTYFIQQATTVDFNYFGPNCGDIITYSFVPFGTIDEGGDFFWNFEEDIESNELFPPDINFQESGDHVVSLFYSIDGCTGIVDKNVYVYPEVIAEIAPQLDSCIGLELILGNQSQNASNYEWSISSDDFNFVSVQFEPVVPVPFQGDFVIELIAQQEGACPDTTQSIYNAYPLLFSEFLLTNDTICLDSNSIDFYAGGSFQSTADFLWVFGENASVEQSVNQDVQNVHFSEPGTHIISLIISDYVCVSKFTDSLTVYPNPVALFSISDTSGCQPLTVQFNNASSAATGLDYLWSFDDAHSSSLANPTHEFLENGNFMVDLTVTTTGGCVDQDSYQFPVTIDVFPTPVANFKVEPTEVQIESPSVFISDLSFADFGLRYMIDGVDTIFEKDFEYLFENVGEHLIVQKIDNEFGCSDSSLKIVKVSGVLFYLPNAFSPNNDGVNDVLQPVMKGVEDFEMRIYSRWGDLVFQSNNRDSGWDGGNNPLGVYNYVVVLKDALGVRHDFSGSVLLIR